MRINLTKEGRELRENHPQTGLAGATGLTPDELTILQKSVVKRRNNLIKSVRAAD